MVFLDQEEGCMGINGYIESFSGNVSDDFLNGEIIDAVT
jgi:hypothetical protein